MRVAFMTLGCKVNQYESQVMLQSFLEEGFTSVDFAGEAEVYVVNTCSVTAEGDRKSRQLLRRAKRRNPDAVVIAAGCYPQTAPGEVAGIPEVDVVVGNTGKAHVARLAMEALRSRGQVVAVEDIGEARSFEPMAAVGCEERTRANIKIEDGCRNYCAYCVIPYARGPVRSKPMAEALREAQGLVSAGFSELVLTGIEISSYGKDTGERLIELLEALSARHPGVRLRLGSVEPRLLTDEFLRRAAALPGLCPHFHISLQSGAAATLKRMNRRYTPEDYRDTVERLLAAMPGAAVTTDVMAGFPGETEEEFEESLRFVLSIPFAKVHVFPFSRRRGTAADRMPEQVPEAVKKSRALRMIEATEEQRRRYLEGLLGRELAVLFETRGEDGVYEGFGENYIPVRVRSRDDLRGRVLRVRVTGRDGEACGGEILGTD